mgnify:CR=1 FL=1
MSFGSLVSKLVKEGKSKEAATKIAGSVANAKLEGAGSGPTAKQKARSNSAAKMIGPQGLGKKGNNGYSVGSSPNTMKNTGKGLSKIVKELEGASKMHLKQSKEINKHIDDMESPIKRTLTSKCKSAAKKKFDTYPSAYANIWASKQQGKGKC